MPVMMSGWETTEETSTRENIAHFFLANQNSGILGILFFLFVFLCVSFEKCLIKKISVELD